MASVPETMRGSRKQVEGPRLPEDLSVIYFGNDWYAINRTSSHHIAKRLARRFRLLYVESPGMRAPKSTGRDVAKVWRKIRDAFRLPNQVDTRMWHTVIPQVPFRNVPLVKQGNQIAGIQLLKRALSRLDFQKTLLWFASPDMGAMAGKLGEQFSVYYCIDDYASLPDVDSRQIALLDRNLACKADQVFVSSPALVEAKLRLNPSTTYSPHGVDVALFEQACRPELLIADSARNLKHPVIGFFGAVEAWVDLDLLRFLGKARPEWTFLFIGRVEVPLGDLARMPNFIFAGPKPYETLPTWAKAFDVAVIPFRQNELVKNVNPLKLREYLATGKPVVSVPMPELQRFSQLIGIAATPQEFLGQLEQALQHDSPAKREARRREVAGMTWEARVEAVLDVIAAKYWEKHQRGGFL